MKVIIAVFSFFLISLNSYAIEATHGMVIFGKENLYAYHLPMFHKVHNRQMVITFDVPGDIKEKIAQMQDKEFLTFVPKPFDLDKFVTAPFDLQGDIYSGHFEKDGVVVMSEVTFKNPKILYVNTLKPAIPEANEHYKIIGTKSDAYAIHLIDGGSIIDQIFKLTTVKFDLFDFGYITKFCTISETSLLEVGNEYSISKWISTRVEAGWKLLATFKVDSLYFTDSVM